VVSVLISVTRHAASPRHATPPFATQRQCQRQRRRPPRCTLQFPLISSKFWWLLVVLVFDFHQILVVFNSFCGFVCFFYFFEVFRGFGNLW
jgi:hypothetical protein